MQNKCRDSYRIKFDKYSDMLNYHKNQHDETMWVNVPVKTLEVEPLAKTSPLYSSPIAFASEVSLDAIEDTAANLGLAIRVSGKLYPVRDTAYKSLLDRAKINGTALPKLAREDLASILNACLKLYGAHALVLIRDEKVTAVHSGDTVDYSVLPINELLDTLQKKLDARFRGNEFVSGYSDHSITCAEWTMPDQKEDLLGAYSKMLTANGYGSMSKKMVPGVRFITSDSGVASAKVAAMLVNRTRTIHIGSCISVDHRYRSSVNDFETALDQLFAQFGDNIAKLMHLQEITLNYPVNAMTRICKKLSLPKKASVEAIAMYEMAYGGGSATAHDVFMAMQEIPFIMKITGEPRSKVLTIQENMARALSMKWSEYDLPKAVNL